MRIGNHARATKENVTVVIPRKDFNLVFTFQPVLDFDEFDKIYPEIEPTVKVVPGGEKTTDYNSPDYKEKVKKREEARSAWAFLTSISATEGLEWSTVKMEDPSTWINFEKELRTFGIGPGESQSLMKAVIDASGITNEHVKEATEAFLKETQVGE